MTMFQTVSAVLQRRVLGTGWTVRVDPDGPSEIPDEARDLLGRVFDARVPGGIVDDLQRAGVIDDPVVDDRELSVAWVSRTDWVYECVLPQIPPGESAGHVEVVFDGLDTVARIELGGVELGRTRNMHRSYRFDISGLVRAAAPDDGKPPGEGHLLAVHLSSAYTEAETLRERVGPRPGAYPEPFNFVRKMACSFGWDWGLTCPGVGIWREARLETWGPARISGLRSTVDAIGGRGEMSVLAHVKRGAATEDAPLGVELALDGTVLRHAEIAAGKDAAALWVSVPQVRAWDPIGYGQAHRYRMRLTLLTADGAVLDSTERTIGFRHLALDRSSDEAGSRFAFHINGRPILVKGINWIPDDIVPGRMTRERYRHRLSQAAAAGVNLVRVWGGGVYESDDFYDVCDELGLLVWQDFPFACAAYPEDEPLRSEIDAEARENVERLSSHPSLVLWNGNNENLWLRDAEHWSEQPGGDKPWGTVYYLKDLPAIVSEVDPARPYVAGSPWSGRWAREPNDPAHFTHHSWEVWNRLDYVHYRDTVPRFVAEFGWQAPPAWRTLRDAVTDHPMTPTSPGVVHHQKAADGMAKLRRGLAAHVGLPRDLDDIDTWHYLTQLTQVRAIETGILHWRACWPQTTGTILWQLNDLWPVISWSAIDGAGRCKPLYHALMGVYADRALTIQPTVAGQQTADGAPAPGGAPADLVLCVLNDSAEQWTGEVVLRRVGDSGVDFARRRLAVMVPARSVARLPIAAALVAWAEPGSEVLLAELDGVRAWWYPTEPKDSAFVGAPPQISAVPVAGGLDVHVTASTLLRDFLLQPDRMHPEATADRGFVTLLPGETATIAVRCPAPLEAAALETPWATASLDEVLRHTS